MKKADSQNFSVKGLSRSLLKKYAAAVALIVLLFVSWFVLFYRPTEKRVGDYARQIRVWRQKIRLVSISQDALDKMERSIQNLKEEIARIESKIYYLDDMPLIGKELVAYARRHHLRVEAITPSYDILFPVESVNGKQGPLVKLPVEIDMTGRFVAGGKFIEDIGRLPFAFAPDGVEFVADPAIYPRVHIIMYGFLFLLNKERPVEKTGKTAAGITTAGAAIP